LGAETSHWAESTLVLAESEYVVLPGPRLEDKTLKWFKKLIDQLRQKYSSRKKLILTKFNINQL
jgi:hypothetical protein